MGRNLIETLMGALVLVVAAFFVVFAYNKADLGVVEGYMVTAEFDRIDGIKEGSDVRISGIKVGTVTRQDLDKESYLAVLAMSVARLVKLPTDTTAEVLSDGIFGDKYISLVPGGAEEMIKPGGKIEVTQGSVDVVQLLGRFMFSQTERQDDSKDGSK